MSGGLKTCEMSVIDGEQPSEQNDGDRYLCDNCAMIGTTGLRIGFRTS